MAAFPAEGPCFTAVEEVFISAEEQNAHEICN